MASFPSVPPNLKSMQMCMKVASDFDKLDPVIAYWCRFYVVQAGLKIDSKSKDSVLFLTTIMDWLEKEKKSKHENEALTNEMVGQAHLENYTLDLFNKADIDDRAANANKNTLRQFLISSILFEVITIFGEVSEDIEKRAKYAKWKAVYLNKCFKSGEIPTPGPVAGTDAEEFEFYGNQSGNADNSQNTHLINTNSNEDEETSNITADINLTPHSDIRPVTPTLVMASNGAKLGHEDLVKAQKFCKFAGSALQYEDIPTAITNLQKALSLLTTGNI